MGFIFSIKISLEMKDEFSEAETLPSFLCCCEAALCVKSHKACMRLGTYWTFGHFFLSPFAFQMALPNPNLPHCTLNRCTTVWGAEEGGPAGRTRNAVPGSGAGRSEDLRWWLRNSHKTMFRAGRWCQQTAAALQCPCRDEVEGCYDLSTLYQEGLDDWCKQGQPVYRTNLSDADLIQMLTSMCLFT